MMTSRRRTWHVAGMESARARRSVVTAGERESYRRRLGWSSRVSITVRDVSITNRKDEMLDQ